jgi:hypothetical protein
VFVAPGGGREKKENNTPNAATNTPAVQRDLANAGRIMFLSTKRPPSRFTTGGGIPKQGVTPRS